MRGHHPKGHPPRSRATLVRSLTGRRCWRRRAAGAAKKKEEDRALPPRPRQGESRPQIDHPSHCTDPGRGRGDASRRQSEHLPRDRRLRARPSRGQRVERQVQQQGRKRRPSQPMRTGTTMPHGLQAEGVQQLPRLRGEAHLRAVGGCPALGHRLGATCKPGEHLRSNRPGPPGSSIRGDQTTRDLSQLTGHRQGAARGSTVTGPRPSSSTSLPTTSSEALPAGEPTHLTESMCRRPHQARHAGDLKSVTSES